MGVALPGAEAPAMSLATGADDLGPAIDGDRRRWRPASEGSGDVCLYAAERSRGRPLLLVHDLRTTSSAYEMRPLFECFRWRRPTYAIDLPGFGLSDRSRGPYSPALFAAVLAELSRALRRGSAGIDVVALGRGAAIAARVARDEPPPCRSLVLVEPSGLVQPRGVALERLAARVAGALGAGAGAPFYALVTSPRLVRGSIAARFFGRPDEGLVAYAQRTARVGGAHHAPMGATRTIPREEETAACYRALTVPVLVVHDARGDAAPELEGFLRGRANRFAIRVSPTRGLPHFERRAETIAALERFWSAVPFAAWDRAVR
jgi:pimeloyl-ACP methyl ester carboxylesterase